MIYLQAPKPRRSTVWQGRVAVLLCGAVLALALALRSRAALAHSVPGSITLSERVLLSDIVVVATIKRPSLPDGAPGKLPGRLLAEATVIERLHGDVPPGPLRFEPHSQSGDSYPEGETVVLFLQEGRGDEKRPEPPLRTVDEMSDRVSLGKPGAERPSRAEILAAVRAYTKALSDKDEAARAALRKQATLGLLSTRDPKLQGSAVRDLAQGAIALTEADAPGLLAVADNAGLDMSVRVAVLEELRRRKLADPAPRYIEWLGNGTIKDRAPVLTAAGKIHDPAMTDALAARLSDPDQDIAAAAARALGEPHHEAAVPRLIEAAAPSRMPVARAVVESLGRIRTASAKAALEELRRRSDDPQWTRMVQTELNLLEQRASKGAPAAPGSAMTAPVPTGSAPRAAIAADTAPASGDIPWRAVVIAAMGLGALAAAAGALRARSRRR